jgi:hypothetical protein
MAHPYPSYYTLQDGLDTIPEPAEGDWDPCPECGVVGSVPVRKKHPTHDDQFLPGRYKTHEHGSEVCPTCEGAGWIPQ